MDINSVKRDLFNKLKKDVWLIVLLCAGWFVSLLVIYSIFGEEALDVFSVLFLLLIIFVGYKVVSFVLYCRNTVNKEKNRIEQEKIAQKKAEEKEKNKRIVQAQIEAEKKYNAKRKEILENPIFFDTETTGLDFTRDEILQLSIIDKDENVLFSHFIKPQHRRTWKEAEKIHKISPEAVKSEKTFDYYHNEIQDIFDKATAVIGYNTEFDMDFLRSAGIEYNKETMDVMLDYAVIAGDYDSYHQDYRWKKLIQCARHYGYKWENGGAHDALNDVKATRYCFYKMMENDGEQSIEIRHQ